MQSKVIDELQRRLRVWEEVDVPVQMSRLKADLQDAKHKIEGLKRQYQIASQETAPSVYRKLKQAQEMANKLASAKPDAKNLAKGLLRMVRGETKTGEWALRAPRADGQMCKVVFAITDKP